ncbi:hypothetical protein GCM10009555_070990 [Acrocarpospora macrocephala]|uniref:MucR family transcriptional regulator n=1 Tax=Acrocarpospora macrocephala TaxID=150177 RepID=A0A5M3WIG3_9ACTN|nr:MucR family transcriptional regulator [Acrocarpospora macrocephala]GES08754.1 hypothetical protein Amac_023500 [Acrocarpospora macrocephala]
MNGSHAPHGILVRDESADRVRCHECGRWFRALGAHVRVHGLTAGEYRERFGLLATKPLTSREVSATRRRIARSSYQRSARTRSDLAVGQSLARTGELAEAARKPEVSPQRRAAQLAALQAGRRSRRTAVDQVLVDALRTRDHADVGEGLRALYVVRQSSVEALAAELGTSRRAIRRALVASGIELRASGVNTDAGRRSRVERNLVRAAERVGALDVREWLREKRAEGWTLARLSAAVGRSVPWVRALL